MERVAYCQGLWRYPTKFLTLKQSSNNKEIPRTANNSRKIAPRDVGLLRATVGLRHSIVINLPPESIWEKFKSPSARDMVVSISGDLLRDRIRDHVEEMALPLYHASRRLQTNISLYFLEMLQAFPYWKSPTANPMLHMRNELDSSKPLILKRGFITAKTVLSHLEPEEPTTDRNQWERYACSQFVFDKFQAF